LPGKVEAVDVTNVWGKAAKQPAVCRAVRAARMSIIEWQKMIMHAIALQMPGLRAYLDNVYVTARL
jgi:phage tail protein X